MESLRIGMRIGTADPFWVQLREAIWQRAQQAAVEMVEVDIDYAAAATAEAQRRLADSILAHELDALVCAYLPADLALRVLERGLPIIQLTETELRHPRFSAPAGFHAIAAMLATFLAGELGGRGTILAVGGLMATHGEDGRSRLAGLRDALAAYPGVEIAHIPSTWRYERALPQIEAALRRWRQPPDAIFGLSDSLALAARDVARALDLLGPQTRVVGINGDPLALAAVAEGSMLATVETPPAEFAAQVIDLACRVACGEAIPEHFSYRPRLVTAANVAQIAAQKLNAIADLPSRLVGVNRARERKHLAQLETSLAINRRVGAILDRRRLISEVADLIRAAYDFDLVRIFLWSAPAHALLREYPAPLPGEYARVEIGDAGPLGEVFGRGEPLALAETRRGHPDPGRPATRERVVLPLRFGGAVRGLIDLHSDHASRRSAEELAGLQLLADQLGIAIRNAELYGEAVDARARAEQADRIKTRLLANVSHELRTPLSVILGSSKLALEGLDQPSDLDPRHDLLRISKSAEHLLALSNDLLDLSRAEIGELALAVKLVDPLALLAEVFHSMAGAARPGVRWRLDAPAALPLIRADPLRIRQVLINLLGNAAKFTDTGQIVLGAAHEAPHLHIWVSDTGAGIPPDMQEQIFEPFVTTGPPGGHHGAGLGLSIARRLVVLHQGSLLLDSAPGAGSTFHLYLPSAAEPGAQVADDPSLLLVSARQEPVREAAELAQRRGLTIRRVSTAAELDEALIETRPAALAWDLEGAGPGDWALVRSLRAAPPIARLPLILFRGAAPPPPESGGEIPPGPILIVDDDPHTRDLYRRLVVRALPDHDVRAAEDGRAALAVLAKERPALVILDLVLPHVDGFAVLEHMRAEPRLQRVPVVVVSGQLLSFEQIERLDYPLVTFQSKEILSEDEAASFLRRALSEGEALSAPTSALVKRALAYIQQHHARDLSRQEIADAVGISQNYLSEIFHRELEIGPWDYLNRYRIKVARELLRRSDQSITAIATAVGFRDAAYFSRVFRRQVGRSPRDYRERR